MKLKKLLSTLFVFSTCTSAIGQSVNLYCELENIGYVAEMRKQIPSFGTLLYELKGQKEVKQVAGLFTESPITKAEWLAINLVIEQKDSYSSHGDELQAIRVTSINRTTGAYSAVIQYRDSKGKMLWQPEVDRAYELLGQPGIFQPRANLPAMLGTCEIRKNVF